PLALLSTGIRPKRLNVAPSALWSALRLHTAVSPPSVTVTVPPPLLPLGSYLSVHWCETPVRKPRSLFFPVFLSTTVANPPGLSPPARQRDVAYSTKAKKLSPRPSRRIATVLAVRHSLTVPALKKAMRTWKLLPLHASRPEAVRVSL